MVHNVSAILTRPAEYRCDRVSPHSLLKVDFHSEGVVSRAFTPNARIDGVFGTGAIVLGEMLARLSD
jgi:hypothetical protein